jgi:hypothetical protein
LPFWLIYDKKKGVTECCSGLFQKKTGIALLVAMLLFDIICLLRFITLQAEKKQRIRLIPRIRSMHENNGDNNDNEQ